MRRSRLRSEVSQNVPLCSGTKNVGIHSMIFSRIMSSKCAINFTWSLQHAHHIAARVGTMAIFCPSPLCSPAPTWPLWPSCALAILRLATFGHHAVCAESGAASFAGGHCGSPSHPGRPGHRAARQHLIGQHRDWAGHIWSPRPAASCPGGRGHLLRWGVSGAPGHRAAAAGSVSKHSIASCWSFILAYNSE